MTRNLSQKDKQGIAHYQLEYLKNLVEELSEENTETIDQIYKEIKDKIAKRHGDVIRMKKAEFRWRN